MARFGSEYFDPSSTSDAPHVLFARVAFLTQIERIAPEVLRELRDDVLPSFAKAKDTDSADWILKAAMEGEAVVQKLPQWRELLAFVKAYGAWAEVYHLTASWLHPVILSTLNIWRLPDPEIAKPLRFHGMDASFWIDAVNVPPCQPFRPTSETWESFKIRNAGWLCQNMEAATLLAAKRALKQTPEKRSRSGSPVLHYTWLVRRHVLSERYTVIAKRKVAGRKFNIETVRKAVTQTAKEIGVVLVTD